MNDIVIPKKRLCNPLPAPRLEEGDIRAALEIVAANTLWLPREFVAHVQTCNIAQRELLIAAHPAAELFRSDLERYFAPDLVVAYPFVRRLIASERKAGKWLHRYHAGSRAILDDNRIPKGLWSHCWCGRSHRSNNEVWQRHGFRQYEASHIIPHKRNNHEEFFQTLFDGGIKIDPSLLFLATWNNLFVARPVAGLTDNSPIVAAVLLNEAERRYQLDLSSIGTRHAVINGLNIESIGSNLNWWNEPKDFR